MIIKNELESFRHTSLMALLISEHALLKKKSRKQHNPDIR